MPFIDTSTLLTSIFSSLPVKSQYATGRLHEDEARLSGSNTPRMAIEKTNLKLGFQFENGLGESRLNDAERSRRFEKAAVRLDRVDGPEDR